jgi:hypothetical protein
MKSDPQVQMVSNESLAAMCHATELFVQFLATKAWEEKGERGNTLEYKHLAAAVDKEESFEFLQLLIPPLRVFSTIENPPKYSARVEPEADLGLAELLELAGKAIKAGAAAAPTTTVSTCAGVRMCRCPHVQVCGRTVVWAYRCVGVPGAVVVEPTADCLLPTADCLLPTAARGGAAAWVNGAWRWNEP